MRKIKDPLFIITAKYGLIAGALICVIKLLLYIIGDMDNETGAILTLVLWIGAMVMAIRKYRDDIKSGLIDYGNALATGVLTVLFASILISVFLFILASVDPGFGEAMLQDITLKTEDMVVNDTIEQSLQVYEIIFRNPGYLSVFTFFSNMFYGTLGNLILALILKKSGDSLQKFD